MSDIHYSKPLPIQLPDCPSIQLLIRHDTLSIIKSETFTELVSDPLLKDELKLNSNIHKTLLDFANAGMRSHSREE
ncbi:hypothetical protein [Paenibacillus pini]|uniref:Uncharacterized protein n=1 Tax=Paenibacillus pini JCM 16418 TaxID=1236976 RepID=W7YHG4_9BACL|nr:hypothetical protein [Paenibacillus pini]GAF07892.1 hypothetical protein JCM16418_1925 [Paenibacillus pini JCM 16418]